MTSILEAMQESHTAKFNELCAWLAKYWGDDPANLSDERRKQIADEAQELAQNWDVAVFKDWGDLRAKTELQQVLADFHSTGETILDLLDQELEEEHGGSSA